MDDFERNKAVILTLGLKQLPFTDSSLGICSIFEKLVSLVPYLQLSLMTHWPE